MKTKRRLKLLAARAAVAVPRVAVDDESELAKIAYDRAAKWSGSPAGTAYDNTPIRELAKAGKR